jgi:sigma-B regulation protein RsbU (phosphoserine phosphatase)
MPVDVVFRRDGVEVSTRAVTRRHDAAFRGYVLSIQILRFFISLAYLAVGLWAVLTKPREGAVRAVALFTFSMAALIIALLRVGEIEVVAAAFVLPGQETLHQWLGSFHYFFGAFWLNFHLLFPRPLIRGRRRSAAAYPLVYGPVCALTLLAGRMGSAGAPAMLALLAAQLLIGFALAMMRRHRSAVPLERRQLNLVVHGSGIGLAGYGLLISVNLIPGLRAALPETPEMLWLFTSLLLMLFSPLAFAYAFGRYRLLDMEARLRRGARHVLVTVTLLTVFFAGLYAATTLLLRLTGLHGHTATLGAALLLSLAFAPVLRRIQASLERRLYPERARLRLLVDTLFSPTAMPPARTTFVTLLQDGLRDSLGISAALLVQRRVETFHLSSGIVTPVKTGDRLAHALEGARPLMVDELLATGRIDPASEEAVWLHDQAIEMVIPLIVHGAVTGFVGLGPRSDGEDFRAEDVAVLGALGSRVALELENLRLMNEAIEKHRLQEQLAMARKVQERFLPRDLPGTPGLEIAAQCRFSLEVAGDYYDVMALEGERTLVAAADVSGKGAGAAMIMSNLRASLRALAPAARDLGSVVSRLNDTIHHDIETDRFITFFVSVYDPVSGCLMYVNAGHNPPRIVRRHGGIEALPPTGRVLGVTPGLPYEEARARLAGGDLLVAYTDGITEAMNEGEEEFGEERLDAVLDACRGESPATVVERILAAVESYTGGRPLGDDCTLLAARVV